MRITPFPEKTGIGITQFLKRQIWEVASIIFKCLKNDTDCKKDRQARGRGGGGGGAKAKAKLSVSGD